MADTCVWRDVRSARPAASRGGVNGQHPKQAADVRAHDYDYEDVHLTEHRMLQVLAEVLWGGQAQGVMPDEGYYFARIRQLC